MTLQLRIAVFSCIISGVLLPPCAFGKTQAAPRGWTETTDSDVRVLSNGKATIEIGPWQELLDHTPRDWAIALSESTKDGVSILSIDPPTSDKKTGAISILRELKSGSTILLSGITVCPGQNGIARRMELVAGHKDLGSLLKGGLFIDRVCRKDPKTKAVSVVRLSNANTDAPSVEKPTNEDSKQSQSISNAQTTPAVTSRPKFKTGKGPKGFDAFWYVAWQGLSSMGFVPKHAGLVTFTDSLATRDVNGLMANGPVESKAAKPKKWGRWRLDDSGKVEFKRDGKNNFKEYFFSEATKSFGENGRLEGCFSKSSISSTQAMGENYVDQFHTFKFNTWCFAENGRFSNDRSLSLIGTTSNSTTRASHSGKSKKVVEGWYRIDGHVIQFVYSDGSKMTTLIGDIDLGEPRPSIILGDTFFEDKSQVE